MSLNILPLRDPATGGAVGGASNLTTVGSVTYVSAAGVINQATSLVVSGAGTTAEAFTVYNSIASGATTLTVKAGAVQGAANLQEWQNNAGSVVGAINQGGAFVGAMIAPGNSVAVYQDVIALRTAASIQFSSTGAYSGTPDASLSRIAPGVIGVGTGAAGSVAGKIQAAFHDALGAGAASVSPILGSGAWFTGGSATTTKPYALIEPAGTTSNNWSTSGTGIGVNATALFAGNLLDLQVAGVSKASVTSGGNLTAAGTITATNTINGTSGVSAGAAAYIGWAGGGRAVMFSPAVGKITLQSDYATGDWGLLQFGGTTSSFPALKRSTTGLIAQLADGSSDTWMQAKSVITSALTVATLPAAPTAGERAFVTDSNAASFTAGIGTIVAAGGTTAVPVVWDGGAWRIG